MSTEMDVVPLYLGKNLAALETLVKEEEICKTFKKKKGYGATVNKIKIQLFQCQNDQEKCYILCRRYLIMMDNLLTTSDDKNYVHQLYVSDLQRVRNLLEVLQTDLEKRYSELGEECDADQLQLIGKCSLTDLSICSLGSSGYTVSEPFGSRTPSVISEGASSIHYLQPSVSEPIITEKNPFFKDIFISAVELFKLLCTSASATNEKLLIVDIRGEDEFKKCHIELKHGTMINIPGEYIKPGLSANALGEKYLTGITQDIWNNRDQFNIIILLDAETERYNYQGSKLERLRSFIVEWDINRRYVQEPVVLEGGIREYVEFYPTEVSDSVIYLSRRNSEMDEILVLESVSYPESGSASEDKLKIQAKDSLADVGFRIERDFPEDMETEEYIVPDNEEATSVANILLPKDIFKSTSEPKIDLGSEDQKSDVTETAKTEEPVTSTGGVTELLRAALETDKTDLLKDARSKKPKQEGGDDFKIPPPILRDMKPDVNIEEFPLEGKGFTGISNLHNNCYMSAILQCMKSIPVIKDMYITTDKYKRYLRSCDAPLNIVFSKALRTLWRGTPECHEVCWPVDFKKKVDRINPVFKKRNHEDAFEFYVFLFDTLNNECSFDVPPSKIMIDSERGWFALLNGRSSFLVKAFYHQIKNSKSCCNCGNVSLHFDIESTLMLAVPYEEAHLQDLVDEYMRDSTLSDYCCTDCKCMASIINTKTLVHYPEVLVIILKRYGARLEGDYGKLNTNISFPVSNLIFGKNSYRLQAVVHHIGNLCHGHYFASVLLDDVWAVFNDDTIRVYSNFEEEIKDLRSEAAGFFYVLDKPL